MLDAVPGGVLDVPGVLGVPDVPDAVPGGVLDVPGVQFFFTYVVVSGSKSSLVFLCVLDWVAMGAGATVLNGGFVQVEQQSIMGYSAHWAIPMPFGSEMRLTSFDQKPSWFNNAGRTGSGSQPSVREDFNGTRERYSILTSVHSWGHGIPDNPPKYCLLFKAKPNGT